MTVHRVIVPVVPDSECGPNFHGNHWKRSKAVKRLRMAAKVSGLEHRPLVALTGPVEVTAVICWPRGRKRMDPTNAVGSLKGLVDGLTDSGWWLDDNHVQLRVDEQRAWSEWGKEAGHLYPGGCVILDIESEGE